jgi:membrane fusion protein (multidrug efflux system)
MLKKFLIAIGGFLVVVLILAAVKTRQIKTMMAVSHVPPPTAVTTYKAESATWNPSVNAIGTLAPVEGVTISADAEGTIVKIFVENGATVKAGAPLLELDTSVELAQLKAAQSRSKLAKLQSERSAELISKNTISQAELDASRAQLDQADAEVNALQAQIEKKKVRAPFDGRVGIRKVNLGQFVPRGSALMPLQKLDPIYVNFAIPQRQLPNIQLGQEVTVTVDAFEGKSFVGKVTAVNSEVDPATRNISVQATIANPDEELRAGMFARVEVTLPAGEVKTVIPATAIAYASYGNSIYIVETMKGEDGAEYLGVRQQFVKIGARRGDLVAITEGLKEGEEVVSSGVFKLRNNAPVQINNSSQPTANATPTPANT